MAYLLFSKLYEAIDLALLTEADAVHTRWSFMFEEW